MLDNGTGSGAPLSGYAVNGQGRVTGVRYKALAGSREFEEAYRSTSGGGDDLSKHGGAEGRDVPVRVHRDGEPTKMGTDGAGGNYVSSVGYNFDGTLATMNTAGGTESRGYNTLGQLTSISQAGTNISYTFPTAGNNGRISGMVIGGESITYSYDVLNQLVKETSSTRGETSFEFDQYGNLTKNGGQSIGVDPLTNRLTGASHDANGNYNIGAGWQYDIENRLVAAYPQTGTGPEQNYGYDPGNKRVWKMTGGSTPVEQVFFYGREGRLGTYNIQWSGSTMSFAKVEQNYYFAGRLIRSRTDWSSSGDGTGWVVVDRLGSVVAKDGVSRRYTPYGQEYTSTPNNEQKFGTYYRDDQTALDYADQRYYQYTMGRFSTPDPYKASAGPSEPGSWNRYAYAERDPINLHDPNGLIALVPVGELVEIPFGWPPQSPTLLFFSDVAERTASRRVSRAQQDFERYESVADELYTAAGVVTEAILDGQLSKDCTDGLARLGVSLPDLAAKLRDVEILNGVGSSVPYAEALQGADRTLAQQRGLSVGNNFGVGSPNRAISSMNDNRVWINTKNGPGAIPRLGPKVTMDDRAALITHEVLHKFGLTDPQIQAGLGAASGASESIGTWLKDNCFKGLGGR